MNACLSEGSIPHDVPQVLINREPLPHLNFDVELLGDCDVIVNELCHRLGGDFEQLCFNSSRLGEITEKPSAPSRSTDAQGSITGASEDVPITECPISLSPEEEEPQTASSPAARETSPHLEPLPETNTDQLDSNPKDGSPQTASPCPERRADALDTADDLKEDEPADRQHVEVRRRCWRSRLCQSPISKRLGGKSSLFIIYKHFLKCCCCY